MLGEEPLILRVGADIPLERQIDPVVYGSDVETLFEITQVPVHGGSGKDLDQVPGLCRLQMLTKRRDRHAALLAEVFKELTRGRELKLPVVEFVRDLGSNLLRPGG